jgi:hypothetical protein
MHTAWVTESHRQRVSAKVAVVALFVSMAGGLVLAVSWFVPLSIQVFVISWAAFLGGIGVVGLLSAAHARSTGQGFWRSLGRGIRTSLGLLWDLFP